MEVLIVLLLAAHLLAMNLAGAGPLVAIYFEWWEANESADLNSGEISAPGKTARWLSDLSIAAYGVGMLIGGGLLTLVWTKVERAQLAEQLTSRINFGIAELVFSFVIMSLTAWWWRLPARGGGFSRWAFRIGSILASTNLLYHFPILFAVADHLIGAQENVTGELESPSFRAIAFSGEVLSRAIHFILASFAACGVAVQFFAAREEVTEVDERLSKTLDSIAASGAWLALGVTAIQPLVGWWVMISLPPLAQQQLIGRDLIATLVFVGGVGAGLGLIHPLFAAACGDRPREGSTLTVILFLTTVVLMTATLRMAVAPAAPTS